MFVEHKEAGEVTEQPAKITKLSDAIRLGCQILPNGRYLVSKADSNYDNFCGGCALGAALTMIGETSDGGHPAAFAKLRRHFDVPESAMRTLSCRHFAGLWTREACADWLEAQGY